MIDDADNVQKLPVRFKGPAPEDRSLFVPHEVGKHVCSHWPLQVVVSETAAEVECVTCGTKLNPVWVLARLAREDSRFHENHKRYHNELKRLGERERTKCDHCGKMTRISSR